MRACLSLLLLVSPAIPETANGQSVEQRVVIPSRAEPRTLVGAAGTLAELCDIAARQAHILEQRGFGNLLRCRTDEIRENLWSFDVVYATGEDLFLAHGDGSSLYIDQRFEAVTWLPTEAAHTDVVRITDWTLRDGSSVVAIETESEFVDFENSDVFGWKRRRIHLCVSTETTWRCPLSAPLSFEQWTGRAPEGGHAAAEGFEVVSRSRARAIAVIRPNGTLRHSLRSGSWHLLEGGEWFDPPPRRDAARRHAIWRIRDGTRIR